VTSPHLLVDISAHGLGHLAQTAPVLAALRSLRPDLRLTLRSGLSRAHLAKRIAEPFAHLCQASDFGFVMHNAIDIDHAASAAAYRAAHADWDARVRAEAEALRHLGATAVLANAAYLPLAGAALAGLPAIGMCSLNWADLFDHYFGGEAWAAPVGRQIRAAYAAADIFLRVTPGMPMRGFANRREIGPVAALADIARPVLRRKLAGRLGLDESARWVLVAMGGIEFRLPVDSWPHTPGVQWLCPAAWNVGRDDVRVIDPPGSAESFTELLAAADAVLTKPGYGTFVEAACQGTPVIFVPRNGWPEEAPLVEWLRRHVACADIAREAAQRGELAAVLNRLWSAPALPPPSPGGITEAVAALLPFLPLPHN
jgi:hypothetical protein